MKVEAGRLVRVEKEDLDKDGCFVCDFDITNIGANAFFPVKYYLKGVGMKSVEKISQYAFLDCTELEYAHFSKCLTAVDFGAFMGCYKLREVIFPESLKFLAHWAFLDCDNIKKVEFFCDLKRLDNFSQNQVCDFLANGVFDRCGHIETFVFHKNFSYHGALKRFERLKEIQIEDERVAQKFWREAIYDSPQSFMLLNSKLFLNEEFAKNCVYYMEAAFEKQFGSDERLAKALAKGVFEEKLRREEEKFFDKQPEEKEED